MSNTDMLTPEQFNEILGKKATCDIPDDAQITKEMVQ